MPTESTVIALCIEATQAEFAQRNDQALALAMQAWQAVTNDYEACIAAHYVARFQNEAQEAFRWHQLALVHANACGAEQVGAFYPSLYVNLGHAYETLGNRAEAEKYYAQAAALGLEHQIEKGISNGIRAIERTHPGRPHRRNP